MKNEFINEPFCSPMIAQISSYEEKGSELILLKNGYIFAKGDNEHGKLGVGHDQKLEKWTLVPSFQDERIVQILCLKNRSYFLTCKGNVYAFGLYLNIKPTLIFDNCKKMISDKYNCQIYFFTRQGLIFKEQEVAYSNQQTNQYPYPVPVSLTNPVFDILEIDHFLYYISSDGLHSLFQLELEKEFCSCIHLIPFFIHWKSNYGILTPEEMRERFPPLPCDPSLIKKSVETRFEIHLLTTQGMVYYFSFYGVQSIYWGFCSFEIRKWICLHLPFVSDLFVRNGKVLYAERIYPIFNWSFRNSNVKFVLQN